MQSSSAPLTGWQVVFLKPRTEKKVAAVCAAHGIPYYLPLRTVGRVAQRRRFTVTLPLFPGYLFAALTHDSRAPVFRTNHVIRLLAPLYSVTLLRDLVQVRRALALTPDLKPVAPLRAGQRVRVIGGPLQGAEGMVSRLAGTMRVVISVNLIGMAVPVTATRSDVEPL